MTSSPARPTAAVARAACEHPDSRIVWHPWCGPWFLDDGRRYRVVAEQCAECRATLHTTTLWESEVEP